MAKPVYSVSVISGGRVVPWIDHHHLRLLAKHGLLEYRQEPFECHVVILTRNDEAEVLPDPGIGLRQLIGAHELLELLGVKRTQRSAVIGLGNLLEAGEDGPPAVFRGHPAADFVVEGALAVTRYARNDGEVA